VSSGSHNINNVQSLNGFGEAIWLLISSIYESSWYILYVNNKKITFRQKVSSKFTSRNTGAKPLLKSQKPKEKQVEIIKFSLPILARLL